MSKVSADRKIIRVSKSNPTMEGAGVRLKRVIGSRDDVPQFDPFLLLDHFGSDNPNDYMSGFPWHPHRGIETVTYMLDGVIEHGDSIGNSGIIESGDIQWMTAGSGIIHQEMPKHYEGRMQGFQLWINLPKDRKMMEPRYRGITKGEVPIIKENGSTIKVIAGEVNGIKGPVEDVIVDVEYLDVEIEKNSYVYLPKENYTTFLYIFEGEGSIKNTTVTTEHVVLFDEEGDSISISTDEKIRFLLISGKKLKEPVAWRGPIVMNTWDEIDTAFREYQNGKFIKM